MKKLVLTLAIVFVGFMTANAQVWLGGSLSSKFVKDATLVNVAPEVGYTLSDIPLSFACAADITYAQAGGSAWMVTLTPYVRYTVATIEKFSFSLDAMGEIGVSGQTGFRAGVRPIVAWNPTEKWTAAFSMGFLGYDKLNYNGVFCLDFETAAPRIGLYYNF